MIKCKYPSKCPATLINYKVLSSAQQDSVVPDKGVSMALTHIVLTLLLNCYYFIGSIILGYRYFAVEILHSLVYF